MFISAAEISIKKFGKLRIKIPQDISSGSHKKIEWICDCRREKLIRIIDVLSGRSTSCGQCNLITVAEIVTKKFGKLRIKIPKDILPGSNKKVEWICDCGGERLISIYSVICGHISSCGRCNQILANEIATKKFGKLRIKEPQDILPRSHKKILWICDCGREKLIGIVDVLLGNTTSCGLCNQILSEEIATRKFGKLRIKTPQDISSGSAKKIEWMCDCGKEKLINTKDVLSGHTTSCGQCNQISAADITTKKFGRLRIKTPQNILSGSNKEVKWMCDCGQEKLIQISLVLSGNTNSCGNCSRLIKNWYLRNKNKIQALRYPINPKDFIQGGMIPLEIIQRAGKSFKAICPVCQKIYYPRLSDIKRGISLTCGCSTYRISMPVIQINEYIRSLGFEVINEYKINKSYYDIFVPKKNLLIEFQGARWHSSEKSKERDLKKKQNALDNGYEFMEVLENDWKTNKLEIKNKLMEYIDGKCS
jgi:hypothetical protein